MTNSVHNTPAATPEAPTSKFPNLGEILNQDIELDIPLDEDPEISYVTLAAGQVHTDTDRAELERVNNILNRLGVPDHIHGYHVAVEAGKEVPLVLVPYDDYRRLRQRINNYKATLRSMNEALVRHKWENLRLHDHMRGLRTLKRAVKNALKDYDQS